MFHFRRTRAFETCHADGMTNVARCRKLQFQTLLSFAVVCLAGVPAVIAHAQMDEAEDTLQPSKSLLPSASAAVDTYSQGSLLGGHTLSCSFFAPVGRLFNRSLVEEFQKTYPLLVSNNDTIKVDFGESPSDWLDYRETGSLLRGVPLEQDAVSHHNFALNILRRGKILLATRCTIQVLRENEMGIGNQEADSNVQPGLQSAWLHCLPAEPVVTMVVSVGTSLRDITAHRRVQLIRDLCLFVDDAKVVNSQSASLEVDKPEGRAVFLSGDGNAPFGLNGTGVSIAWPLACGGDTSQLPTLDQVELTAGDGSMSQAIGFDVLGWRVENRRQAGLSRTAKSLNRLLAANDDVKSPLTVLSSRGQRESKFTFSHRHLSRLKRGVDTSPGIFAQPPVFLDPPNNDRVSPVPSSPDISSIIPLPDKGGEPPRQDAGLPGVRVHRRTYFEYQIPANAFSNAKNGDTRSLKVSLMDCEILAEMFPNIKASCKWLTIDTDSQVLYGVPPKASTQEERKQQSTGTFLVFAEDSGGRSAMTKFDVTLLARPHPSNHRFSLYFSRHNTSMDTYQRDLAFARSLSVGLGADGPSSAPPGSYTLLKTDANGDRVSISWFDNSLGSTNTCDREGIRRLWSKMTNRDVGTTSTKRIRTKAEFKNAFLPHFVLRYAKLSLLGPCAGDKLASDPWSVVTSPEYTSLSSKSTLVTTTKKSTVTTTTTRLPTTTSTITATTKKALNTFTLPMPPPPVTKPPPSTTTARQKTVTPAKSTASKDLSVSESLKTTIATPQTVNEDTPILTDPTYVLKVPAVVGMESRVRIPDKLFASPLETARNHKMSYVLRASHSTTPLWIAVDQADPSVVVLPSAFDALSMEKFNSTHLTWKGDLMAVGSSGRMSEKVDVQVSLVVPLPSMDESSLATHVFVTKIHNYDLKNFTALDAVRFLNVIATLFGDTNSDHIYVHPLKAGSVVFSWHNTTLSSTDRCPYHEIAELGSRIDGNKEFLAKIKERFAQSNFQVNSIKIQKQNACASGTLKDTTAAATTAATKVNTELAASGGGGSTGLIIVIVVIVCVALLFLLAVYKCRSSKNAKRKREDKKRLKSTAAAAAVFPPGSPFAMESPNKNGNAHKTTTTFSFKPDAAVVLDDDLGEIDATSDPLLQRTSTFTHPAKSESGRHSQKNGAHPEVVPLTAISNGPEAERPPPPAYVPK